MTNKWISGVLGLVVLMLPFLNLTGTAQTWTLVITGFLIMVTSFWGMLIEKPGGEDMHGVETRL